MNYFRYFTFLLLAMSFITLVACNSSQSKRDREQKKDAAPLKKLSDLEQNGLATKKIIDTIFLDYKFGMTKNEVSEHTFYLAEQGKLKKDYADEYYFEIDSKLGTKYQGKVFAGYFDGKLISFGLVFDDPNPILVFSQLSDLYESKYGEYDYMDKPIEDLLVFNKIWVRDNLKIIIRSGISDTYVNYIDLRFEKQKIRKDSLDKIKKEDELKKGALTY